MTPDRFRQIEELYHSARERTGQERQAILAQADPELRREVESLLSQPDAAMLSNRPAMENADDLFEDPTVTVIATGAQLGPYRIERKLGEGGMGEVFQAVDTRLGRAVAVKVSHARFSSRFEREAHAISSLNHPHICTLYDVGPNYLVMELVEGETIASRLKSGPIPLKTALEYASQIAAALTEAHSKGVVHRDLKPGNIMIAKSGVKVLDFGLAKTSTDETMTASQVVMGTPAYMAPEQRHAKPADARSDIYSFGCILYEMLTGGRIGAHRKRISSRKLEKFVDRCLEEDPTSRWQSAADLQAELGKIAAHSFPWKTVAIASAAAIALAMPGYFYLNRAPKLTDKDTIVLADFDNKTGDAVFDDTLRQGLSVELQQSPFLSLVPDTTIARTLTLMGQPKGAKLTREVAQEICERTASTAVLEGSIASLGSQYVLGLVAKNCRTGTVLDQEQIQVAKREDVLNSLSEMARKFRTKVGESLATVEKFSSPLAEMTTSSLEALKAYSTGLKLILAGSDTPGADMFRHAVEIDPKFAMAYAQLGLSYSGYGESELAAQNTTKAWQLRDRVSDQERFFIDFAYDRQVTGNLEKAYQTLEVWLQTYPRQQEPNAQALLGGLATHGTGRYERVIEASKQALAKEPDLVFGYANPASALFFLGRFTEAEDMLRRAAERKIDTSSFYVLRYGLAFLAGDQEKMNQLIVQTQGQRRNGHWIRNSEALALAQSGKLQAARGSSSQAANLALQEGDREQSATYQAVRAVWESLCGNTQDGSKGATAALALSKGRDVEYAAGLALALSGNTSQAEALAADLEKRFPEDTFAKFTYVPVLHGLAALDKGKTADSLEYLQPALQYERAVNGLIFHHFQMGSLHSAYVRGQALFAQKRYTEATAEFQKILDHRGLVGPDPLGSLVYLQLGRTYAASGDQAKAKGAYESFLKIWKDADLDVPILKRAKAEYEKLK